MRLTFLRQKQYQTELSGTEHKAFAPILWSTAELYIA